MLVAKIHKGLRELPGTRTLVCPAVVDVTHDKHITNAAVPPRSAKPGKGRFGELHTSNSK